MTNIKANLNQVRYSNFLIRTYTNELKRCSEIKGKLLDVYSDLTPEELGKLNKITELEVKYSDNVYTEYLEFNKKREEAKQLIVKLSNYKQRAILFARYITCKKWEEIAVDLQINYVEVLEIHGKAIKTLNSMINKQEPSIKSKSKPKYKEAMDERMGRIMNEAMG